MSEGSVPTTIRWPADLHEQLRKAAFEQRRPMSHIVIEATREALAAYADVREEGNK